MGHEEDQLQIAIANLLRLAGVFFFHTANEGQRNRFYAYKLKRMGLLAGVPDLIVVDKDIWFIEIKTPTGKQSPSQKSFQENIERLGHKYLIWRSVDDANNFLKNIIL